jgi:UDP-glucose 4-epimerase
MTKLKALVTGGGGFIGSHLCNKLLKNNYEVIAYDDLSNGSGLKNLMKDIKLVKGNILNIPKLKNISKKVNVVFHLAVKPLTMSFDKPEEVIKVNDYGTYLVAKVCTELKLKLIYVSSSEVYGDAIMVPMRENHPLFPTTIYAGSKAAGELYVKGFEKTNGLKTVIVRPFNSYGEYMRGDSYAAAMPNFFNRISKNLNPIIHGTGNQTRDFTYVEDTCEGIILADQSKNALGDTFNIGQGKEFKINNIAKMMIKKYEESTGKQLKLKLNHQKSRKGDVLRHRSDITHAFKILGYKPKISLEEGISRYINWRLMK